MVYFSKLEKIYQTTILKYAHLMGYIEPKEHKNKKADKMRHNYT